MSEADELQQLRDEVQALRSARALSDAWDAYRDRAKAEVAQILGLPPSASIHQIIGAIVALKRRSG